VIHTKLIGLALAGAALMLLETIFYVHQPRPLRRLITPNALVDYCFCAFNLLVMGALTAYGVAALNECFRHYLPWLDLRLIDGQPVAVKCIITYVLIDFVSYVSHWIRHRVDWLWLFHAIHHSQEAMNPLTNLRSHPVDQIAHRVIHIIPAFILGGEPEFWFWFGGIDNLWGYFVHSDLRVNLGPLKYLIVTPQYHRIHHSIERRHWNKNFSDRLVIWDYLFRTRYAGADDEYPDTGIAGYLACNTSYHPRQVFRDFIDHMLYPFQIIFRSMHARARASISQGSTHSESELAEKTEAKSVSLPVVALPQGGGQLTDNGASVVVARG
jgi:sterol desaturase/sphingolipid hydroxylase (fatty acid hydroxylase superfamily)